MSSLLLLDHREVAELLPMDAAIDLVAGALAALVAGTASQPLRQLVRAPEGGGLLGLMPGEIGPDADGGGFLGIKVITVFPPPPGLPAGAHHASHRGVVLLFDGATGEPVALLDAASLTAIRTAAASGLATRLLARPEAAELAILGSGVQAASHLEAICAVRPIRRVRVWSRNPRSAERFAAGRTGGAMAVEVATSAEEAVAGADVVCTVTAAAEPVLQGRWLAAGTHVNAVGACTPRARELDTEAVARARLYVDCRESALAEAGDFLIPREEGAFGDEHIVGELGEVLLGRVPARRSAEEITLFESLGVAVEDLAAARHVVQRARREGRGRPFEL